MPDLPQGQGAPQGQQPPQGAQGGGGITEALTAVDQTLTKIVQAMSQNQQVPKDVTSAFQGALQAFRQAEQSLIKSVGGQAPGDNDGDEGPQPGGSTTMQQGGGNAVPLTHANMRGGR